MTNWTKDRVIGELWKISGGVEPKFWFGDTAIAHRRRTLILGMQWRDQRLDAPSGHSDRKGWWYSVLFEGDRGLRLIHEDCLAIAKPENLGEKQCPKS